MNLQQFNALKIGDTIVNHMANGSEGTVTDVTDHWSRGRAVKVKWGPVGAGGGNVEFSYTIHSTAWMHWSTEEPEVPNDCMCGRGAPGDKPCPGPDGNPACFVEDIKLGENK